MVNWMHELHCFVCQILHYLMSSYSIFLGMVMGLLKGKKNPTTFFEKRFLMGTTRDYSEFWSKFDDLREVPTQLANQEVSHS